MRVVFSFFIIIPLCLAGGSCKKSGFLNTNPNSTLILLNNIADCQALLDNDVVMNGFGNDGYPYLGVVGCDDYYSTTDQYANYTAADQLAVIWSRQLNPTTGLNDWSLSYRTVSYANQALISLQAIHPRPDEQVAWNDVEGGAFFFRAWAFFQVAQIFCPAFDSSSALTDPGIPLPMTTDVSTHFTRATVQETYTQILSDLAKAALLLPADSTGWSSTRPGKAAVYALMARVQLTMGNYPKALVYSDSCIRLQGQLMQYDTIPPINPNSPSPFYRSNPEVIFDAIYQSSGPSAFRKSCVDSLLYQSYAPNDLRRLLFFVQNSFFVGRYDEQVLGFFGLATDEMWLTRAECYARAKNAPAALDDLNHLLQTRWVTGSFVPYTATDADDVLRMVLTERRKELLFRGTRWTDLRRLNKDTRFAITITRSIGDIPYTLPPNDDRYVWPIPGDVFTFNPTLQQNKR